MKLSKFLIPLGTAYIMAMPAVGYSADDVFTSTEIVIDGSDSVFEPFVPADIPIDDPANTYSAASSFSGDVSALDSMRAAINYSPSLKSLRESRTTAQYELSTSMSSYLPTVDVQGSFGYGLTSTVSSRLQGIDKNFYPNVSAVASASQLLFSGFGVKNTVEYNQERVVSMDYRVLDNASSLALEALIAHSEVLRLRELQEITADYVETHLLIISQLELLVASGINTTSDVSQAQGRLVNAQVSQQNVRNAYEVALINYKLVTGKDAPESMLPIDIPIQNIDDVSSIIAVANASNPQILALQADYEATKNQVGIARSGYFPTITLDLQATYDNDQLSAKPTQEAYSINASVGASWNIFNGFATENSRRAANANTRVAQQNLLDIIDNVKSDVQTTFEDYIMAETLRLSYSQALLYNSSTRDSYMSQFRFGTRPLLDLLDAESELYGTQVQLGIMASNRIIGAWRLLALQGTLLEELGLEEDSLITDESNSDVSEVRFSF